MMNEFMSCMRNILLTQCFIFFSAVPLYLIVHGHLSWNIQNDNKKQNHVNMNAIRSHSHFNVHACMDNNECYCILFK